MYKAIIFDFFDVIRTDVYKYWLNSHDYKLEGQFLDIVQSMDRGEIKLEQFLADLSEITGQDAAAIFEEMEEGAAVDYDVINLVERLRKHYKTGLLSNAPSDFIRELLREHDLEKYFDVIVISSEVGLIKPEPDIFYHILSELGVHAGEAVFVDDASKNVAAGESVGIKSVLYKNATGLQKQLAALGVETD